MLGMRWLGIAVRHGPSVVMRSIAYADHWVYGQLDDLKYEIE